MVVVVVVVVIVVVRVVVEEVGKVMFAVGVVVVLKSFVVEV